jgi:hypothetical protein
MASLMRLLSPSRQLPLAECFMGKLLCFAHSRPFHWRRVGGPNVCKWWSSRIEYLSHKGTESLSFGGCEKCGLSYATARRCKRGSSAFCWRSGYSRARSVPKSRYEYCRIRVPGNRCGRMINRQTRRERSSELSFRSLILGRGSGVVEIAEATLERDPLLWRKN